LKEILLPYFSFDNHYFRFMKKITQFPSLLICLAGYLITYIIISTLFDLVAKPEENMLFITLVLDLTATLMIFLMSLMFNNSSFYDPYWSLAPVPIILVWYKHAPLHEWYDFRQWIIISLVLIWSFRLTLNWTSRWKGLQDEDWRYARYRSFPRPVYWLISLVGFHLFPTLMVYAGCLAVYPALCLWHEPPGIMDGIALIITFSGIAIEAVADRQLKTFLRKKPDQPFLITGLWKFSRHPNYFGEILFWTGLFTFSIQAKPFYWYTLAGPAGMILMFTLISIPMMDKRMVSRKPGYADYAASTSALVPWKRKV